MNRLFFIYQSSPEQIIIELKDGEIVAEHKTEGVKWRWGPAKGGSRPLEFRGNLLRFFHSTLDNELKPWYRRYYIGALVMEPEPPFKIIQVSKEPIIRGSEIGLVEQKDCNHFKGQVVFPGGAIKHKDKFLLAFGENDAAAIIAEIGEEDLKL